MSAVGSHTNVIQGNDSKIYYGKKITFDKQLRQIIEKRNLSVKEVANKLGVQQPVIYYWLKATRVPAIYTKHVEKMQQALDLSEDEYKYLKIAQERSLRLRSLGNKPKKDKNQKEFSEIAIEYFKLNNNRAANKISENRIKLERGAKKIVEELNKYTEPTDGYVSNKYDAATLALKIIFDSINKNLSNKEKIINIHQVGANEPFSSRKKDWQIILSLAIIKGWTIYHYISVDMDEEQVESFAKRVKKFFKISKKMLYIPYKLPNQKQNINTEEYIIYIPNQKAVHMTQGNSKCIAVLKDRKRDFVALNEVFNDLKTKAEEIITIVEPRLKFLQKIAIVESEKADRYLIQPSRLSSLMVPDKFLKKGSRFYEYYKEIPNIGTEHIDKFIDNFKNRITVMHQQKQQYKFKFILSMDVLERIAKGKFVDREIFSDCFNGTIFKPNIDERILILENMLNLIEEQDSKVEIALIPKNYYQKDKQIKIFKNKFAWEIKGQYATFMDRIQNQSNATSMVIQEPTIVKAVKLDYERRWKRVKPIHKNKEHITLWLRYHIGLLKMEQCNKKRFIDTQYFDWKNVEA